jgi:anti-sigma regulatory factor (Ser/Thr protein kinase)
LAAAGFHHEALLYRGDDEFVSGTLAFARAAIEAGGSVVAVVDERKGALLRDALDIGADKLALVDGGSVGRNPARLIPAWRDYAERHADDPAGIWGIGEPVWAGRSDEELVECHQHERLVNLAFADVSSVRFLCPYDAANLGADVIATAACTHPWLGEHGATSASGHYVHVDEVVDPLRDPLVEPPPSARGIVFEQESMYYARRFVAEAAERAGFDDEPIQDLLVAINELITNSVRHGGGGGVLHVWTEPEGLVCQVRDRGRIAGRLLGRELPAPEREGGGGLGLWLVNQICDLVQVRAFEDATVVRVHMNRVRPNVQADAAIFGQL